MQSIAKTVIGALKYQTALRALPNIEEYYNSKRSVARKPEEHAELLLAHQTYGQHEKNPNDISVKLLLKKYNNYNFFLIFDFNEKTGNEMRSKVAHFMEEKYGGSYEEYMKKE